MPGSGTCVPPEVPPLVVCPPVVEVVCPPVVELVVLELVLPQFFLQCPEPQPQNVACAGAASDTTLRLRTIANILVFMVTPRQEKMVSRD